MKKPQILISLLIALIANGLDGARYHHKPHCATAPSQARHRLADALVSSRQSLGHTDDISSYCIDKHNEFRRLHQVDDLVIDKRTLLPYARRRAADLAANKSFNPANLTYGINWGYTAGKWQCDMMVKEWHNTLKDYNFTLRPEQANEKNRWFTQLVWSRTTYLACARSTAVPMLVNQEAKFVYWNVCVYDPKGNIEGQFRQNVFPKVE